MEKLLEMAVKVCDQAEVYSNNSEESTVIFENGKTKNIERSIQSGIALRIFKDNRQGFSYTKNLNDRERLLQNALEGLRGGARAPASLPGNNAHSLDKKEAPEEQVDSEILSNECRRVYEILKKKTKGQLKATANFTRTDTRIINSRNLDLSSRSSEYNFFPMLLFPGSFANINRLFSHKNFSKIPEESLEHIASLFNASQKQSHPKGGKMKILFLPETITILLQRLVTGTSGQMIFQKQSPLGSKIGEKILDDKLTILDNPLANAEPGEPVFDDEGTLSAPLPIVEKGVLKNFFADRLYAGKIGITPTGHGYKAMGTGDPISFKPSPALKHLEIEPGDKSFTEMIESIDRGIIPAQVLGGHTGNIPAGDYALGLSPGIYIEDGKIAGHVKDAMIAGNIYQTLNHLEAIENCRHITLAPYGSKGHWKCPAILSKEVSVAIK